MRLVLDRFEEGAAEGYRIAVLETEDGAVLDLPASFLPKESEAGDVFRLELAYGQELSVIALRRDQEAGRALRDEAARRLARLRGRDPGGDLEL